VLAARWQPPARPAGQAVPDPASFRDHATLY
jgi:hypothetical protein